MSIPVGINYSGGTSSKWAIAAIMNGELERPEHVAVFFSDTGDEHEWTYEAVDETERECAAAGIEFVRTRTHRAINVLSDAILKVARGDIPRIDNPPFWTENQGGGRGQLAQRCTQIYKSRAIRRAQTDWLQRIGLPHRIESWIGFATDEAHRATKAIARNDLQWVTLGFPAIKANRSRGEQRADLVRWNMRAPAFSMCVICPYKDPKRWRQTTGADLAKAIEVDEAIRHGLERVGVHDPCYLTDRLIPVERLVRDGDPQSTLPGFESPGCESGMCFL